MPRKRAARPNFRLRLADSGRWYIDWTEDKKPRSVSTRTSDQGEAEQQRQQLEAGWDKPAPPKQPTIGEILDGYLAERKGHVESYGTLVGCCDAVRRHVGGLQPAQLSRR